MPSIKCKNTPVDPKSVLLGLREKSVGLSKAQTRIPWREIIRIFIFCLNDTLDIPDAVENSDCGYCAAAVIYGIIDDKIV